jgi:hypothetical protein
VVIGLFGIIGMAGVLGGPLVGRLVDTLVPWYATLFAMVCLILSQAIQTGAGGVNIGAVVVACVGLDLFRQMQQVSLAKSIFSYVGVVFSKAGTARLLISCDLLASRTLPRLV